MNYKLLSWGVLRLDDGANIPNDIRNTDWQAYQSWLLAGNAPVAQDAAPLPTNPINDAMLSDPAYSALVKAMAAHFQLTVAQIVAMITAQVGT